MSQPDRSGGEHHLDGRFVTDVSGLHCAIAEALLGPGRYFGRQWNAFKDCLGGGFGVVPPLTLAWHDSEVARRALADLVEDPDGRLSSFEEIVRPEAPDQARRQGDRRPQPSCGGPITLCPICSASHRAMRSS
ncbi:barstar family protein [Streptomyces sp. NPDC052610]|uniref:barstar family protein n=1 Tax=Streptomyces sp. NPDC052610 TaxID=3154952 RepID=UPI00341401B1